MIVHALVDDLDSARRAVAAGATVVQLRVKAPTDVIVERGRGFRRLGVTFVVNDDVDAALELGADGVHLGQADEGADRVWKAGLLLGRSASTLSEALATDADYLGVGPVWATPSKVDAEPADRARRACRHLRRGRRPGCRDRRHRRGECRRVHPGGGDRRCGDSCGNRPGSEGGCR